MKPLIFFSLLFLIFSCQLDQPPEIVTEPPIEIVAATAAERDIFLNYLTDGNPNARINTEFSAENLVRITDRSYSRWAVPSSRNPDRALSFSINEDRSIDKVFISSTVVNDDRSVTSKIYATDDRLMMEFVYTTDRRRELVYKDPIVAYGYWEEWDKCLDTIGEPFPTNFANNLFDFIANTSTLGMWTPAVHLVCLGVAGGLNYQNNQRK